MKDIKEYLPFYVGQECTCDEARFKITGVQFTEAGTGVFDGTFNDGIPQGWWVENCDFKLLLRPLSDMAQDERMEESSIFHCEANKNLHYDEKRALIVHYLLKQGFDLFGLIDAGLAIDKTKLKP